MHLCRLTRLFTLLCCFSLRLPAEPIHVRLTQGAAHGFLVVRSESGAIIAHGEVAQSAHGDRMTSRITLRFVDGSLDDETTVFTQHGDFAPVSDHHIQHGPFFKEAIDLLIEANGQVTLKLPNKQKVETSHIDLPPDVSNGFLCSIFVNIPANAPEFHLSYVVGTGNGRLIKLRVTPESDASFRVGGARHTATIFRIHPELGGVAGVVAPIIGKQPDDAFIYVVPGEVPAFIRGVGQLAEGGPVVSTELAGTAFAPASARKQ